MSLIANKLRELREYAARLGCQEVDESIMWRDAFPEFKENAAGATLAGYRQRQGLKPKVTLLALFELEVAPSTLRYVLAGEKFWGSMGTC